MRVALLTITMSKKTHPFLCLCEVWIMSSRGHSIQPWIPLLNLICWELLVVMGAYTIWECDYFRFFCERICCCFLSSRYAKSAIQYVSIVNIPKVAYYDIPNWAPFRPSTVWAVSDAPNRERKFKHRFTHCSYQSWVMPVLKEMGAVHLQASMPIE